jgi:hypothetical protein
MRSARAAHPQVTVLDATKGPVRALRQGHPHVFTGSRHRRTRVFDGHNVVIKTTKPIHNLA